MNAPLLKTLLTIEPTESSPRNSEGALLRLGDGALCLAYTRFTGGSRDNSGAEIARRLSRDEGLTWSGDEALVRDEGRENVMSVSLLRLASGEVLFFYLVKNGWDDCKLYVRRSSDELSSLSERVCATPHQGYHVVNNDRVVQLRSGRLVVPASRHPEPVPGQARRGIATCFLSDDQGYTWRQSGTVLEAPLDMDPDDQAGLQEPGVVELADGTLFMWMRTELGSQFESLSRDGGETWSPVRPGKLVSPRSPASIKRLPWDGRLMAVWNDHSGRHPFQAGKRTPLCVALSVDEAETWSPSRVIEHDPDGWYCYTLITFIDDGVILGYCAGDLVVGGLNRLKLVRIDRQWLDGIEQGG